MKKDENRKYLLNHYRKMKLHRMIVIRGKRSEWLRETKQ